MAKRKKDNPDVVADTRDLHAKCPDENLIAGYATGNLNDDEFHEVVAHLNRCRYCAQDVAGIIKAGDGNDTDDSSSDELEECKREFVDGFAQLLKEVARPARGVSSCSGEHDVSLNPSKSTDTGGLTCGDKVGRYVLLERIGCGGMGIVYAAFDPELDRKVALKLLRPDRVGSSPDEPDRVRLLREAQAMARLSHPNVIAVHDVQTFDDEIALAMEFVDGVTLRRWQDDTQPTWRQCLDVYTRAGEGIAAAHQAGLVHRDFKPDNVLLGKDGRVRVTDFGLVRQATELQLQTHTGLTEKGRRAAPPRVSLDTPLTQTGAVLGTPAYMPPEQLLGKEVDARSDQYSFCVALYEALYGERPYTAKSFEELRQKTVSGDLPPPPKGRHVPAWLRNAVVRGLSKEPDKRYSSMNDLLGALQQDPAKKLRRRLSIVVVGAIAAASAVAIMAVGSGGEISCKVPPGEFDGVWDAKTKTSLADVVWSIGSDYSRASLPKLEEHLDRYVEEWKSFFVRSCSEAHEEHNLSPRDFELRISCLRRRRKSLRFLAKNLVHAQEAETLDNALKAVQSLATIQSCIDPSSEKRFCDTSEPERQTEIEDLQAKLDGMDLLIVLGKIEEGFRGARSAFEQATKRQCNPFVAESLFWLGRLHEKSGDYEDAATKLRQAALLAALVGRTALHAKATVWEIWVLGPRMRRYADAEALILHAPESVVEIAADDPDTYAIYLSAIGFIHLFQGRQLLSVEYVRRSADEYLREFGEHHYAAAVPFHNLAIALHRVGKLDEAKQRLERAITIVKQTLGPQHKLIAHFGITTAGLLHAEGHDEAAIEEYERWLPRERNAYGDRHPYLAEATLDFGYACLRLGQLDRAERLFAVARGLFESVHGPTHPSLGFAHVGLGEVALAHSQSQLALNHFRTAEGIFRDVRVPTYRSSRLRFGVARAFWEDPTRRDATRHLKRHTRCDKRWPPRWGPRQKNFAAV